MATLFLYLLFYKEDISINKKWESLSLIFYLSVVHLYKDLHLDEF